VNSLATGDVNGVDINTDGFVTSSNNHSRQVLTELTVGSSDENFHNYELITDQRVL
jgi:hypothetical protein